jgi:hypothetical protein
MSIINVCESTENIEKMSGKGPIINDGLIKSNNCINNLLEGGDDEQWY